MKILLVNPSRCDHNGNVIKYRKAFLPPLALAILARLTPEKHQLKVVNDIVEDIDFDISYDLVGITTMTIQAARAYQIADRFREKGVRVIIGGMHPTVMPDEVKNHSDSIAIGEAEDLWQIILEDAENGCLKKEYKAEALPSLEKLIIPAWEKLDMSIYPKPIGRKFPQMPLFTTRGCPMGCKFCSVTRYFGKSYRFKPVGNVLEEIKRTGAEEYFFVDDNIVCKPEYSREFFRELAAYSLRWFSQISTTILRNPDLIELMAKAGCFSALIGIESLNKSNLSQVNKGFNQTDMYEELFARLHKAGVGAFPSIIFGFDEDTPEVMIKTLEFLKKNKIRMAYFWILTPLPGTVLFEEMRNEGRISTTDWSIYDLSHVVFKPKHFTPRQLENDYWKLQRKFFSIPNITKRILSSLFESSTPLINFATTAFFQTYFHQKVSLRDHPISGGIGRISQ
ncbi:MAG: B12-binding domain-containing radical SAM protein [Candidatus Riflebacteria bacterium]|nr:B12-binding domain-containing radical SAM protein [Candidatus Riflebacteria bacterium]